MLSPGASGVGCPGTARAYQAGFSGSPSEEPAKAADPSALQQSFWRAPSVPYFNPPPASQRVPPDTGHRASRTLPWLQGATFP